RLLLHQLCCTPYNRTSCAAQLMLYILCCITYAAQLMLYISSDRRLSNCTHPHGSNRFEEGMGMKSRLIPMFLAITEPRMGLHSYQYPSWERINRIRACM